MSLNARMKTYSLYRASETLDAYGMKSATPSKITDIQVSITKNEPTHDTANPSYDTTSYIGITQHVGVLIGDILQDGNGTKYLVSDIGNRLRFQPLYLNKI